MNSIAALVISLPERENLLREALDSVQAQTRPPDQIHLGVDLDGMGEAANMNRLIDTSECEWLAFLHDDDLWYPNHLEVAGRYMTDDYDVIVANFRAVGRPQDTFEPYHEDFNDHVFTNWYPPAVVVARKSVFGHWIEGRPPTEDPWFDPKDTGRLHSNAPWIDWANWRRLVHEGARFVRTRKVTVDYRFLGGNGSWTDEQAAQAAAAEAARRDVDNPLGQLRNLIEGS